MQHFSIVFSDHIHLDLQRAFTQYELQARFISFIFFQVIQITFI